MRVKKLSPGRKVLLPSQQVAEAIERIMQAPVTDLPTVLVHADFQPEWSLGRSDLHNWIPVLDRFDGILANYAAHDRTVILAVLNFDRLLLEHCASRNLFNSYDNLDKLLASHDLDVLEYALELLVLPARKLEAHRHLMRTYSDTLDLKKLKLFSGLLLPEETNADLDALQAVHRTLQAQPDVEGRHLHVKLMSLFILLMLDTNSYDAAHSTVFSVNPLLIEQTVDIISNEDKYAMKPVASALYVLRACLKYEFKGQELSSALQLHSASGFFMSRLRKLNRGFISGDLPYPSYYLMGFCDLLFRLCATPEFDSELLNLGVMPEMMQALEKAQPRYFRFLEKYVQSVESLLSKVQGAMDIFISAADGLNVLVRMIGRWSNAESLSDVESSFLSALLKLTEKILQNHGSDERLRNLVETPLFSYLATIFKHSTKMTADVLSRAMNVMSTFVHNEPNTLSIVQEAGVPTAFLQLLLHSGIPRNGDFLARIFTALSALCLNSQGLQQVLELNPFRVLFACFLDRSFSRFLLSHGTSTMLGQSLDEFIRHHPSCKELICDEIILMLQQLPQVMTSAAQSEPKLNTISPVASATDDYKPATTIVWDLEDSPASLLYEGVVSILEVLIQNPGHFEELRKRQFVPLVARCLIIQLPFDFVASASAHAASHLFRIITESPENGLLETLLQLFDECYPQVNFALLSNCNPITPNTQDLEEANKSFQALIAVSNILDLLCEVHINSIQGHLRTMASWAKLVAGSQQTMKNIIELALRTHSLYLTLERFTPAVVQKTAFHFKGRDWERPIGVLLDINRPGDELPILDSSDTRIYNVRKLATVEREVLDSVIALLSAISASASLAGRKTTDEEEQANQGLLTEAIRIFFSEACQREQLSYLSLAFFMLEATLHEDLSGKVSLLLTPLKPVVQLRDLIVRALEIWLNKADNVDLPASFLLSIAGTFLDAKTYRNNCWDELCDQADKNLQGVFEMLAQCVHLLIKAPESKLQTSKADLLHVASLIVDPSWPCVDPSKVEVRQLSVFVAGCKGLNTQIMVEPTAISWMRKFDKADMADVEAFARSNLRLSPMAAAVILTSSSEDIGGLAGFPSDQLIQLILGMLFFSMKRAGDMPQRAKAANLILPSFVSLTKMPLSELTPSAQSAILLGLSLIVVSADDKLPLEEFWTYASQFWTTTDLDVRHALLQLHLALVLKGESTMSPERLRAFLQGNFSCLAKLVQSSSAQTDLNVESHQSIIHLLIMILRLSIERSQSPSGKPYSIDLMRAELCNTFRREFLFEELFSDRVTAGAILHPEAFVDAFRDSFSVIEPGKKFKSVASYRQHLDRELRLRIKEKNPQPEDTPNELILGVVDFVYASFPDRSTYGTNYGYCAFMLVLCELSAHYPAFLSCLLNDARLPELLQFMLEYLTPASPMEIPALSQERELVEHVLEHKEKMISRAWCQYFLSTCLSGCWRNDILMAVCVKSIVGALVANIKKCHNSLDSTPPLLFGLADTLYHLLTFSVASTYSAVSSTEEQASRHIISKLVSQLVESKVAVLMTMLLRNYYSIEAVHDRKALLWRDLVRGKVVRLLEVMTRYGNRLKRVHTAVTSSEGEDDGYESFDDDDDLPVDEEEELLAEMEGVEEEMMSSEGRGDEDDMYMSMDDADNSEGAMDVDDDSDASSTTLDNEDEAEEMEAMMEEEAMFDDNESSVTPSEEEMSIDQDSDEDLLDDDSEDDVEYEIEIEPMQGGRSLGTSTYHLSPDDVDLRERNDAGGRTINRFISRLMDTTTRNDGNIPLDVEEEFDREGQAARRRTHSVVTEDADTEEDANELAAMASGRLFSQNTPDANADHGDEDGEDEEEEEEDESDHMFFDEDGQRAMEFEIQAPRGLPGRRRRFHDHGGGQGLLGLQGGLRRMMDLPSTYAGALSGPVSIPPHPLLSLPGSAQTPTPLRKADLPTGPLAVLMTPISVGTGKRWQHVVSLFRLGLSDPTYKERLRRSFVDASVAAFVPGTSKKPEVTEESTTEGFTDLEEEMSEDSDEGVFMSADEQDDSANEVHAGEEHLFTDHGADVDFLTALPFDMRAEVLGQHFEQRRMLIPPGTTRVIIDSAFLQRLPEDLRDEYVRMSEQDFRLFRHSHPMLGAGNPHNLEEMLSALADLSPEFRMIMDTLSGRGQRANEQAAPLPPVDDASGSGSDVDVETPAPPAAQPSKPVPAVEEGPAIVDTPSLLTLLQNFVFEPVIIKDRRTSFRLFVNLCSNSKTRGDLLNMLLVILEKTPSDMTELSGLFETFINARLATTATPVLKLSVPARPASVSNATPSPQLPALTLSQPDERVLKRLVFVQRTLQLLMYLVSHSSVVSDFFVREDQEMTTMAVGKKTKHSCKLPLILLFMALENEFVCSQPMLTEYLMHLIALVVKHNSPEVPSESVSFAIPPVFLHILVKSLQTASFNVKGSLYATQCFTLLSRRSPVLAASLLLELSEHVARMLRAVEYADVDLARILRIFKILNGIAVSFQDESEDGKACKAILALLKLEPNYKAWLSTKLAATTTGDETVLTAVEVFFLQEKLTSQLLTSQLSLSESLIAFAEKHRALINEFIRQHPTLLLGSFSRLSLAPHLLEFDNKRIYFKSQLHKRTPEREQHTGTMTLNVRRPEVFEDSFHAVMSKRGDDFRYARLNVKFHQEDGVDVGGVTREWFSVLSRAMFNPDYALFKTTAGDKITYQPNRQSFINPDHLQYFRFVGRIIAKAIHDNRLLDCYFTRSFYKQILGKPVDLSDLEAVDPDFYKSMQWVLANDISNGVLGELTFSIEVEDFGDKTVVDLKPRGREILVDESNKREYVQLVSSYKLAGAVFQQMDAFLKGFFEVIPRELIAIFDEQELELLISGLPDIDVDDWKNNTDYHNAYTLASPQIQWFWRCVRAMTLEERAKLIQFVTGTSKVPLEGFAHLQGSNGRQRFQIHRDCGGKDRLPSAHTCFNQLDLPEYETYEQLRDALRKAIGEYGQGFGLA